MADCRTRRPYFPRAGSGRSAATAAIAVVLQALLVQPAAAHTRDPLAPHQLWGAWTLDPWVLLGIGLPAWLYTLGLRRLWARAGVGKGVRRWQAWCYGAGIAALIVALISPLDSLGGALFSAHMLQHVVLMMVAAPLLVLGNPVVPFLWALPTGWRPRVGRVGRIWGIRGIWHVLKHPIGAWGVHAAAIWVWHAPVLYQLTLVSEGVHILQHLSFFGTALLFWWAAFELSKRRSARFGVGVLYIFTTAVHSSILGALLTFSLVVWYPMYAGSTAAWGLTPLEDQQLGGLIMWVPAGIIYVVASLALLAAGLGLAERSTRRSEARWADSLPVAPLPLRGMAGESRPREN